MKHWPVRPNRDEMIRCGPGTRLLVRCQGRQGTTGVASGPDQFIPAAARSGMIIAIGGWVLRTACQQLKAWQAAGAEHLRVTVNLSARQFRDPKLVEAVAGALEQSGLDPRSLELELTESSIMQQPEQVNATLGKLREKGLRILIDDFGTGYSSLSYLKRFPIDALKIDR